VWCVVSGAMRVTCMNESCVTYMNESCVTHVNTSSLLYAPIIQCGNGKQGQGANTASKEY